LAGRGVRQQVFDCARAGYFGGKTIMGIAKVVYKPLKQAGTGILAGFKDFSQP
jgi:hypothetical protein